MLTNAGGVCSPRSSRGSTSTTSACPSARGRGPSGCRMSFKLGVGGRFDAGMCWLLVFSLHGLGVFWCFLPMDADGLRAGYIYTLYSIVYLGVVLLYSLCVSMPRVEISNLDHPPTWLHRGADEADSPKEPPTLGRRTKRNIRNHIPNLDLDALHAYPPPLHPRVLQQRLRPPRLVPDFI